MNAFICGACILGENNNLSLSQGRSATSVRCLVIYISCKVNASFIGGGGKLVWIAYHVYCMYVQFSPNSMCNNLGESRTGSLINNLGEGEWQYEGNRNGGWLKVCPDDWVMPFPDYAVDVKLYSLIYCFVIHLRDLEINGGGVDVLFSANYIIVVCLC